jgi:cysteine synthase A
VPSPKQKKSLLPIQTVTLSYSNSAIQQFSNSVNPAIYEKTTGPEIREDTASTVDVFIYGVCTSGTLTGVGRHIKHTKGKAITMEAAELSDSSGD